VVVTGVSATGDREVLGVDVGDSEDGAFWTAFLKGLRSGGLGEVKLVISNHHLGRKNHRQGVRGRVLATVPGALHAQRLGQGPLGPVPDGAGRHPDDLRPGRSLPRGSTTGGSGRHPSPSVQRCGGQAR